MQTITLMSLLVGLLIAGLSVPLARRRIPPNSLYGLRVPATFGDEEIWYEANARCGREGIVVGVTIALLGVLIPAWLPRWRGDLSEDVFALLSAGVLMVVVVLWGVRSWRYANRLRDEKRARGGGGESR